MKKKDDLWWLVVAEGVVAVLLGIYILVRQEQASTYIGMIAAGFVFITGITQTIGATTNGAKRSKTGLVRGIAGIIIGGGLLAAGYFDWVDLVTGYTLLAIGLLIYGGLGLWHGFFDRGEIPFSWGPILLNGFFILWGILVFVARMQGFSLATASGWILIIIGIIAGVWGLLTRPKGDDDGKAVTDNS